MIPGLDRIDKEEIRRRLPLAYVCGRLGIGLNQEQRGLCPLHEDSNPSLRLWQGTDGETLWWCDPCNVGGDLYELIMRARGVGFTDALALASEFADELPPGYEPPPAPSLTPTEGPADWELDVFAGRERAAREPGVLALRTRLSDDPAQARAWDEYLRATWGWGLDTDGGVLMPHWTADAALTGCKIRYASGNRASKRGSRYDSLYGSWLGRRHGEVLVTEGETDCVYAAWTALHERVPVDVFALPAGAKRAPGPAVIELLKRSSVIYLALDPDPAGVAGTRLWLESLALHGFDVRVCSLPRGLDVRASRASVRALLATARRPLAEPTMVVAGEGGYYREDKNGNSRQVCTWTLEPTARLVGGDEPGYEVELRTRGGVSLTALRLAELGNVSSLRRWANRHDLIFPGTDADVQAIATLIAARGAITPEVFQTSQVGLHAPPRDYAFAGPSVIYPEAHVGKLPWRYVPGAHAHDVTGRVLLPTEASRDWSWIDDLLALSDSSVTHPLLAWIGATARRTEVREFPILFIGGSSGVGKSTLARYALRLSGSAIEADLGAVTAHVLLRTLASSRTLPVFIDEWTRKSRRDTREALQGNIPNLYTGGRAERGQADLTAVTYDLTSPVIVAGEDTFTLDRELDRTVRIAPTRAAQNHVANQRLRDRPLEALGQDLHRWLTTSPALPSFTATGDDRPTYNRQVLEVGWQTLALWLHAAGQVYPDVPQLPAVPDMSGLNAEIDEERENVYEVALAEGVAMRDTSGLAVVWGDERGTWMRTPALIELVSRNLDLDLPGGSRAMRDYFRERYGEVKDGRVSPPGSLTKVRAHLIPGLHLETEDELATLVREGE